MKQSIFLFMVLLLTTGCATSLSERAAKIQDADTTMTDGCKFLDDVRGSSGWGGTQGASVGMENAKNEAREKAAKMDATHIIWIGVVGGYKPTAFGKAYLCK
jgi:uncharacterized protein YceK